jgi:L-seryl-tRNA(Ser) seleniumtransferase
MEERAELLRAIPAVDVLLRRREIADLAREISPTLLARWVREAVEGARREILEGRLRREDLEATLASLPARLAGRSRALHGNPLRRVINATGIVVHTNLGRAPLAAGAIEAMGAAAAVYSNLEYDIERGERGSRGAHLGEVAAVLFPGKGLLAVNNNAAAVLLVLNTLAEGKEVVISRGELVEIGGSFRIPEVMAKAGATLREIGTTNRTRIADYRGAISPRTGLLIKVHTSNYRIVGFVEETPLAAVAALGREQGIPVVVDQGSGSMLAESESGLSGEPDVASLLADGASLVTFSGDKLLGGPQAGLIVGDEDLVRRCARNPLARALRIDKTRIGALAWTLAEHAAGRARRSVPVMEMLSRDAGAIEARARAILEKIERARPGLTGRVQEGVSRAGGGAAPLRDIPTRLLALAPENLSVAAYEEALRRQEIPVIARIAEERLLIDLRTVDPSEDDLLARALIAAAR